MASLPPSLAPKANQANLTLGGYTFSDQEIPESLSFPVDQNVAIHDFPGGKRVIQTLGVYYPTLNWSGILRTSTAETRSNAFRQMLTSAAQQKLTYLSNAFSVIVTKYVPDYKHIYRIDYSISVEIVSDLSGTTTATPPQSIDQQNQAAISAANQNLADALADDSTNDPADGPTDAEIAAYHDNATSAVDAAGPAAQASGASAEAALTSIQKVITTAQKYIAVLPPNQLTSKLVSLTSFTNNWIIVGKNFANGQAPKTITVSGGGSFAKLAAQYYNDVSLAGALQSANGHVSPNISSAGPVNIVLPPFPSKQS